MKRIINKGIKEPVSLFLAAHEPEPRKMIRSMSEEALEEWAKRRTIQFGAVPEKLIDNKTFWRTYLPIYRADYRIIGNHRFEELDIHTEIPATVFYSETDKPLKSMERWTKYFSNCTFQLFEGSHFFIREQHEAMAARIEMDIRKAVIEAYHV